jgi:hypothetical protein
MAKNDLPEKTLVNKVVENFDDLEKLRRSRPLLFIAICVAAVGIAGWWIYDHTYAIPKLKSKVEEKQANLSGTSEDRDRLSGKLDKFLAVAEKLFSNAPPDQRLELLAQRLASLESFASQKLISSNTLQLCNLMLVTNGIVWKAWVTSQLSDAESVLIASQLSRLLLGAGNVVAIPPSANLAEPVRGLLVEYDPALAPSINVWSNVFRTVSDEIHRDLVIRVHQGLDPQSISVTVGLRK